MSRRRWKVGPLGIALHPWWSWPPQGYRRLYRHSVNWWSLGIGPLILLWTPVRSHAYLRARDAD